MMQNRRRVVITGLGTLTPVGNSVASTWEGIKKGKNGIAPITHYDASNDEVKLAAELKDLNLEDKLEGKEIRRTDRFTQLALYATSEAIEDSGLDFSNINVKRTGVYYTSGIGGLETINDQKERAMEKGYHRLSPFFIPSAIINLAAGNIAIKYGIKGPAISHVTACASSTNALGEAFRAVRDGYLDLAITGGSEGCVIPFGIFGFSVMQALYRGADVNNASIPFDVNRGGFVMGEGAGTLIIEELEHAKKRNAKIYAEVIGYAATCDATHITGPDPEGNGAKDAMLFALEDGEVNPNEVDYINAHGTSTPLNDKVETLAIKNAFGQHAYELNVSSTKSMTGHLLGATGAVEAIITTLAVRDDFIPPTINTKDLDPECDLNYTLGKGLSKKVNYALSNSLGFGGHNATVVIKKYQEEV
ncbi:MAG: beta-ketoacyl-ACP synthase II [Candidatus Izemoplasmatales bacterium]|jgi:3-oxoacyl-[acyl-carrier-protein] synthase II|nr:beta-ketoacyl-ACP synthase II [Candidatus Izemoplasmatales bacterium]